MKTIYKFPFAIVREQTIQIQNGFEIIHVGLDPQNVPCIWAIVDTKEPLLLNTFYVLGTGHPIPSTSYRHVGTVVTQDTFVWHLFY